MQREAEQQIKLLRQHCLGSPQTGASASLGSLPGSILMIWYEHLAWQLSRRSQDPLSTQLILYGVFCGLKILERTPPASPRSKQGLRVV